MENLIEIHNNFLPTYIEDQVENLLLYEKHIRYSYFSSVVNPSFNIYQPGFGYQFFKDNLPKYFNEPQYISLLNILYSFCIYRKIHLTQIIQGRSWLSLPSPTPLSENIHTDLDFSHWVLLYYVNDSDGDTILFNSKEEEIQRVTPQKGKAIFFDGSVKHCGSQPAKSHRAVINFNFLGEFFGEEEKN